MRTLLTGGLTLGLLTLSATALAENPVWLQDKTEQSYPITVYHSESCGCCKGWIEHLQAHNFVVNSVTTDDLDPIKQRLGVPSEGASCHTAEVNGKVIEGHVPAQDIKALLAADSDIRLLTVPGMPQGGPGMDYDGAGKDPFRVWAITDSNQVGVYREYRDY